jgi:hypothetical protein
MSYLNDYIKPSDYGVVRKDINRILSLIHDITAQEPEDEGLQERICISSNVKLRTTSVTAGSPNLTDTNTKDLMVYNWRRKKPTNTYTYDLIHTSTGSGFTFPSSNTWDGARVDTDGTSYITITDHTDFDFTDEIGICMKVILPASGGGFVLCEKVNEYRLRVVDTNTLEWAIYTGGAYQTAVTYTYTPLTEYSIVATYKSTGSGQKLYINGILEDSDSITGAINNSTGNLCIMATAGGTNISPSGTSMAYFGLLNKELSSSWVTDYHTNSLYDTSDGNIEVTTINFIGNDNVTTNAEVGLFKV